MKHFGPDETLCDVYKRLNYQSFQFSWGNQIELFSCGEIYEVTSALYHQFKVTNDIISQFLSFQEEQSIVIIISGGNVPFDNINEIDSIIAQKIETGQIKEFKVFNALQLLALLHIIKSTIFETNIFFVFHSLTSLLVDEKPTSIHSVIFQSIKEIVSSKLAYAVWLTSVLPVSSGLRDQTKDSLSNYWRITMQKKVVLQDL